MTCFKISSLEKHYPYREFTYKLSLNHKLLAPEFEMLTRIIHTNTHNMVNLLFNKLHMQRKISLYHKHVTLFWSNMETVMIDPNLSHLSNVQPSKPPMTI